jgi:hypothetical protein
MCTSVCVCVPANFSKHLTDFHMKLSLNPAIHVPTTYKTIFMINFPQKWMKLKYSLVIFGDCSFWLILVSMFHLILKNETYIQELITVTNSMEQSPSREANSHTAGQEIPILLWNLKVHTVFTRSHHWSLF